MADTGEPRGLVPTTLSSGPFTYRYGAEERTLADYLDSYPVTGLLIARQGELWCEEYRFDRTAEMRLQSWSMAKSVTSLLLGICLDRGLIASLDDTADAYLPELRGTLHGGTTLNQLNMSSGVAGVHASINSVCYPSAFESDDANIAKFVASMNERQEPEGALQLQRDLPAHNRDGHPLGHRPDNVRLRRRSVVAADGRRGRRGLADRLDRGRVQLHRLCEWSCTLASPLRTSRSCCCAGLPAARLGPARPARGAGRRDSGGPSHRQRGLDVGSDVLDR